MDVFALTSHIEANPAVDPGSDERRPPVVATNVGSIHEAVVEARRAFWYRPATHANSRDRVLRLLNAPLPSSGDGRRGREAVVESRWSIEAMVLWL